MIVKFIKDHPIGIPKGTIKNIDNKRVTDFELNIVDNFLRLLR